MPTPSADAAEEDRKLSGDILWTLGSFGVLAASGLVINVAVAGFRDAAALGVFNLAYAVYIIVSQVAVLGVHYSVLRAAAQYHGDLWERSAMLLAAVALSLALGSAFGAAVFAGGGFFAALFDSEESGRAISYAGLGLCFFAVNKVLIAYINGLRHMRAFSVLQAMRYVIVMSWVSGVAASTLPFELSGLAFIAAEVSTTVAALLYVVRVRAVSAAWSGEKVRSWLRRHLSFGIRSAPSGMFLEVNTRVDALVIGVFLSEREVGIYTFAATLVDGLYHVLAMIRVNVNPILVAAWRDASWAGPQRLLTRTKQLLLPVMVILAGLALMGYYVLGEHVLGPGEVMEGVGPLVILLLGLTLVAPFVPFDNLLLATGHPGFQTLQHLTVVLVNLALNLALVPVVGMVGAAGGLAAGYLVGTGVLLVLADRMVGWNLTSNTVRSGVRSW